MKPIVASCLLAVWAGGAHAEIVSREHRNELAFGLASIFGDLPTPAEQVWFNDLDTITSITVGLGQVGPDAVAAAQTLVISLYDSCAPASDPPLAQGTRTDVMLNDLRSENDWKWVTVTFDRPVSVTYGKYYYFTAGTPRVPFKISQNRYLHGRYQPGIRDITNNLGHPTKKQDLLFKVAGQVDSSKPAYPTPRTNVVCDGTPIGTGPRCIPLREERGFPSTGSAVNVLVMERLRSGAVELPGSFWDDYRADPELRMLKTDVLEMLERDSSLPQQLGLSETPPFSEIYPDMNFYLVVEDPARDLGARRGIHYCANIDVAAVVVRTGSTNTAPKGHFWGEVLRTTPTEAPTNNDSCSDPVTYLPDDQGFTGHLGGGFYRNGNTSSFANDFSSTNGFASGCGGGSAPDAIYKFRLLEETRVRISTAGSQFDTVLSLRDGSGACPFGADIECNDDSPQAGGSASFIDRVLQPGEYAIIVDGAGSNPATNSGVYNLQVSGWGRTQRHALVHEVFGHGVSNLNDEYQTEDSTQAPAAREGYLNNPPIGCLRVTEPSPGPVVSAGWCSDYLRLESLMANFNATESPDAQNCWAHNDADDDTDEPTGIDRDEMQCRSDSHCLWLGDLADRPDFAYFHSSPSPGPAYRCIPRRIIYHNIGIGCDARPGVAPSGCFIGGYRSESVTTFNVASPSSVAMDGALWHDPPAPAPPQGYSPGVENLIRTMIGCVWPTSCYGYDYAGCSNFIARWDGHDPSNNTFLQLGNACELFAGVLEYVTRR